MKRMCLIIVMAVLCASSAYAWQGRMQAMGNPLGLVQDEADFLVHPSFLRNVEDLTLVTSFSFEHLGVLNYEMDNDYWTDMDTPGYGGDILADVGLLVPLGTGTLGLLFSFDHGWQQWDGTLWSTAEFDAQQLATDFMWSALYGVDMSQACGIGLRVDIGVHNEWMNSSFTDPPLRVKNEPDEIFFSSIPDPGDRGYGEARFTLSADGEVDDMSYAVSGYGGFYFAGYWSNTYDAVAPGVGYAIIDNDGNYSGFVVGGDLWMAYQATDSIRVPFTLGVEYERSDVTSREPGSIDSLLFFGPVNSLTFEYAFTDFNITTSLGVDAMVADDLRLGAGLCYSYFSHSKMIDRISTITLPLSNLSYDDYDTFESGHTLGLNANAEWQVDDGLSLLAGVNLYGTSLTQTWYSDDTKADLSGYAFGVNGSLGLSAEFDGFVIEPFVSAGLETRHLGGEWKDISYPNSDVAVDTNTWHVRTGVSIAFDGF